MSGHALNSVRAHEPLPGTVIEHRMKRAKHIQHLFADLLETAADSDCQVNGFSDNDPDPCVFPIRRIEVLPSPTKG